MDIITRVIPYFLCIGAIATNIWIVEQLGLAIILSFWFNSSPLISGTINFFVVSILHAEELSITVTPFFVKMGAHFKETSFPAEKIATSNSFSSASSILINW